MLRLSPKLGFPQNHHRHRHRNRHRAHEKSRALPAIFGWPLRRHDCDNRNNCNRGERQSTETATVIYLYWIYRLSWNPSFSVYIPLLFRSDPPFRSFFRPLSCPTSSIFSHPEPFPFVFFQTMIIDIQPTIIDYMQRAFPIILPN